MHNIVELILFAGRRARARPGLFAVRFVGAVVAVILVSGVQLYSSAMGDAMLRSSLSSDSGTTYFAVSVSSGALTDAAYAELDGYIRGTAARDLGLPLHIVRVHHSTGSVSLYSVRAQSSGSRRVSLSAHPLATAALNYDEDLAAHASLIAGALPLGSNVPAGPASVVVARDTALRLHLHVGDTVAFSANGTSALQPLLEISGIFAPTDPGGAYWSVSSQGSVPDVLITTQLSTFQRLASHASLFNPSYFWLQHTDLSAIHLADADALLDHLTRVDSRVASITPGAELLQSLSLGINGFQYQYNLLPTILLILVSPIAVLILYSVVVTTALVLERQAGEILLMRSRGAARSQVFAIYMVEGAIFAVASVLVCPPLGLALAVVIDHASGFLTFGGGLAMELHLTPAVYLVAAITACACVLIGLLPALMLTRRSLLAYTAEQGRMRQQPFWQRGFLDLVLLALALYGLVVLRQQGQITSGAATAAVAQDPVVAVAPILFSIAIALLIGRALPQLAGAGLRALARFSSPALQLALQSVARAPRQPMRLVQLSTLTLTFGIFAATVAGIETRNAADQQAYEAGATVRLQEFPNAAHGPGKISPLADYRALPGVRAVMPALRFESTSDSTNATSDGTNVNVLGIDPGAAPVVIWYRSDFADLPLVQLLALIGRPDADAVVSDTFLQATGLHPGDTFQVILTTGRSVTFKIAGTAHYFPTLDPRAYPFVVANLAYLERASHAGAANEAWMAADPRRDAVSRLIDAAHAWLRPLIQFEGIPPASDAGTDPLKVGIYGVVSVGFLIAIGLALLGFIAFAYLSMQQRLLEFAVVRALGLSEGGLRALLLYEQVVLLGAAIVGGIAAGVLTTQLYLPYLPIATRSLPPFLVITPWSSIVTFVLALFVLFLLVLSVHVLLVMRLPLGRVLRLGDA